MTRIPTGINAGKTYPEVFLAQVCKRKSGCWEWYGPKYRNGYGKFSVRYKGVLAHRYAYQVLGGRELVDGKCVCHTCDNRLCVNPAHLRQETQKWNMQDAKSKGRLNAPRGSAGGNSKLTESQVLAMRKDHERGALQKDLAAKYGVSGKQVSLIVRRIQWSHL